MNNLILHIGLPKTGTTTLQKTIFPYTEDAIYFGRYGWEYDESELLKEMSTCFRSPSSVWNTGKGKNVLNMILDNANSKKNLIFSDERITLDVVPTWNNSSVIREINDLQKMGLPLNLWVQQPQFELHSQGEVP
jgi:hypothetical protein